jgi:hypothetical protein
MGAQPESLATLARTTPPLTRTRAHTPRSNVNMIAAIQQFASFMQTNNPVLYAACAVPFCVFACRYVAHERVPSYIAVSTQEEPYSL